MDDIRQWLSMYFEALADYRRAIEMDTTQCATSIAQLAQDVADLSPQSPLIDRLTSAQDANPDLLKNAATELAAAHHVIAFFNIWQARFLQKISDRTPDAAIVRDSVTDTHAAGLLFEAWIEALGESSSPEPQ